MDTSTVVARADTIGQRVVPRRFRSLEEKQRIIAEATAPAASVAAVARKHGVNANLLYGASATNIWRSFCPTARACVLLARFPASNSSACCDCCGDDWTAARSSGVARGWCHRHAQGFRWLGGDR